MFFCIIQAWNKMFSYINLQPFTLKEAEFYIRKSALTERINHAQMQNLLNSVQSQKNAVLPFRLDKALFYLDNKVIPLNAMLNDIKNLKKSETEVFLLISLLKGSTAYNVAFEMLQYSAYLDPDFLCLTIFAHVFNMPLGKVKENAEKLVKVCLAEIHTQCGHEGLTFHRLTQEQILMYIDKHAVVCLDPMQILTNLLKQINVLFEVNPKKGSNRETTELYLHHAVKLLSITTYDNKEIKRERGDLFFKVGLYYVYTALDYQKAIYYFQASYDLHAKIHGKNDLTVFNSLKMLALSHEKHGAFKTAIEFYNKAVEVKLKVNTDKDMSDRDIANLYEIIGVCYDKLNDSQSAVGFKLNALKIRQKLYANEGIHAEIAMSLNSLAVSYQKLGKFREALEYDRKALRMRQELYIGNHSEIADSLHSVGTDHENLHEWKSAFDYFEMAYYMRKELFNDDHADIAASLHCMAVASEHLDDLEQSVVYDTVCIFWI